MAVKRCEPIKRLEELVIRTRVMRTEFTRNHRRYNKAKFTKTIIPKLPNNY